MNASLRRRLFAWISAAILGAGGAMAGLSFLLSYRDANALQDAQLEQVAAVLAAQAPVVPSGHFRPRNREEAETHLVVRLLGAPVVDADPRIDVFLPLTLHPGLQSLDAFGVRWRAMVRRDAGDRPFAVAQRQTVRDEIARDSAVLALGPLLVLLPLLMAIVHRLLRQGFAPLAALSRQVDAADDGRLAPLDAAGVALEALPLVQAVNRLLRRLAGALEQQRRMVADAAHELRTPVAAARVQADNLAHAELPATARGRLDALQHGLARISDLIEQLLALARVQGATASQARVSLEAVVRAAIEQTLPLAEAQGVDLGCLRLDAAEVCGDAMHLHALACNAIANAVRYTPRGGTVDVSIARVGADAVLSVEDTGPGIPAAQRERVFEPFFRILGTRQTGSGLGLAIVRSAAQALGGEVRLEGRTDGRSGLHFTYRQKAA